MPNTRAARKAHPRPTARPISSRLLLGMDTFACDEAPGAEELGVDSELFWGNKGKLRLIALLPGKGRCSHAWFNARRSLKADISFVSL